jgi:hypothetical protein
MTYYDDYSEYESPKAKWDRETKEIDALLAPSEIGTVERPALTKLGLTAARKALRAAEGVIGRAGRKVWGLTAALKEQRADVVRLTNVTAAYKLRDQLRDGLSSSAVRGWYAAWESIKGYGPRDGQKQLLLQAKNLIIDHTLRRAKENDWTYGIAIDPTVRNRAYRRVLYIDTPQGQISYHLGEYDHRDLPYYMTPWTGRHDSEAITRAVIDAEHQVLVDAIDLRDREERSLRRLRRKPAQV